MPRIRTIKPDFFTSDTVSALPLRARLTWIGLWTHCDDYGRCRDNVRLIKAAVWPLDDVSLRDIESDLDDLEKASVVFRYTVGDKNYIQVTGWAEHQKVDRPSKSTIPTPSEGIVTLPAAVSNGRGNYTDEPPTDPRETVASPREDASSPRARKGKERKGKEGTRARARDDPPDPKCPEHTNDPEPPPCGACADRRRARERWDRDQARRAAEAQQATAHDRAEAGRLAIEACTLCDDRGYVGATVCAHDPASADRTRRGAAAARAALTPGAAA